MANLAGRVGYDVVGLLQCEPITTLNAGWRLPEAPRDLRHLEVTGMLRRDGGDPERSEAADGA